MIELDVPGARLHCLERGPRDGRLVVMWHGFPDSAEAWLPAAERLAADGARVIMPYQRGYAPSSLGDRYHPEALWSDVIGVLDALGAPKAVLVGHDWGAINVLGATALHPGRVEKLITLTIPHVAAFRFTLRRAWLARHFLTLQLPGAARRLRAGDFAQVGELWRRWSPGWDPPPAALAAARAALAPPGHAEAAIAYYREFPRMVPPPLRAQIEVPSVAIVGDNDPALTPEEAERARRKFARDYEVVTLSGGHFLHYQDPRFPDALARAI